MSTKRPIPVLFLAKSHIDTYTRKDGVTVQAHDDKRQAAAKDWRDEENWHSRTMGRMKTLGEDQLRFVIKDAREAAKNAYDMGNQKKAGQYEDEAHYAAMELEKRAKPIREAKAKHDAEKSGVDDSKFPAGPGGHPKGFKPGQYVMFPHPDKPGKKALGKFVGVRDGQSVVRHDKHGELKMDHSDVVYARGVPGPADESLERSKAAAEHVRQMQEKAKTEGGSREKFVKLDDRV